MMDEAIRCPKCTSTSCRIVWNAASVTRLVANILLFPLWSLFGYFGDTRGTYLALPRECTVCGTRFESSRFLRFGRSRNNAPTA